MADKPPTSTFRYPIIYLLAIMAGLLIFQYYSATERTFEISYSEFRHLAELQAVNDLVISSDSIKGQLLPKGIEDLAKSWKSSSTNRSPPSAPCGWRTPISSSFWTSTT
jgi:hypothetical protein